MYSVNEHPKQEQLNNSLGKALAITIKDLRFLSKIYQVDAKDLAEQYLESFKLVMEQSFKD